jgi:hypothetical protein
MSAVALFTDFMGLCYVIRTVAHVQKKHLAKNTLTNAHKAAAWQCFFRELTDGAAKHFPHLLVDLQCGLAVASAGKQVQLLRKLCSLAHIKLWLIGQN